MPDSFYIGACVRGFPSWVGNQGRKGCFYVSLRLPAAAAAICTHPQAASLGSIGFSLSSQIVRPRQKRVCAAEGNPLSYVPLGRKS